MLVIIHFLLTKKNAIVNKLSSKSSENRLKPRKFPYKNSRKSVPHRWLSDLKPSSDEKKKNSGFQLTPARVNLCSSLYCNWIIWRSYFRFKFLDEEAPPPKAPSPEVVEEDMDAERAFEKLRKAAHVRPWDHGKDGLQKPCTLVLFFLNYIYYHVIFIIMI